MVKKDTAALAPMLTPEELKLCPTLGFLRIAGGKYKLRIIWLLAKAPTRYGVLSRSLSRGSFDAPITHRTLSRELRELQEKGIVWRELISEKPLNVEYGLTERGRTLLPVIEAIVRWGLTGVHEEILGLR